MAREDPSGSDALGMTALEGKKSKPALFPIDRGNSGETGLCPREELRLLSSATLEGRRDQLCLCLESEPGGCGYWSSEIS